MEKRGQVNTYVCETCKEEIATINLNTGVTPFTISCRIESCPGYMRSGFYRLPKGSITVRYAWFRPCTAEFAKLPIETQEHILTGGLILRLLSEASPMDDQGADEIFDEEKPDIEKWLVFAANAYHPHTELWNRVLQRMGK